MYFGIGFPFDTRFITDNISFQKVLSRMDPLARLRRKEGLLTENFAQNKSAILVHSNPRGNKGGHPGDHSVPVMRLYRAMKRTVTSDRAAPGKGVLLDIWEHLTIAKCYCCESHIEAENTGDEHSNRNLDRYFRLCMKCSDRSRVQPNRDLNAAINVLRLLTTEVEEQGRLARSKPEVRAIESGGRSSQ